MVGWSGDLHHQKPDTGARPNGRSPVFLANHPKPRGGRTLRSKPEAGTTPTPPALARRLACELLAGATRPRVLDPACGEGELLLAALEARGRDPEFACSGLFGIELQPERAERARQRLHDAAGLRRGGPLERHIVCADALDASIPWPSATHVLANPPWVSLSGRQSRNPSASRAHPRRGKSGWPSLHGAFLERIAEHIGDSDASTASVLLPASVVELAGYASTRELVTGFCELDGAPEELGEHAFPGVVEPAVIVRLRPIEPRRGQPAAWSAGGEGLERALRAFPRLESAFADPGVHTGNAARALLLEPDDPRGAPVREGRCLEPYRLGPHRRRLRTDLAPTHELRFRIGSLERYRAFPVLLRQTADRPIAALHTEAGYFRNSLLAARHIEGLDPAFVVAILNGPIARAWHRSRFRDARQRSFPQVKVSHLRTLPFPFANRERSPRLHDELADRVRALNAVSPSRRDSEIATIEELGLESYGPSVVRCRHLLGPRNE